MRKKGIRINALCPGGVKTELTTCVEDQFANGDYVPGEIPNMRMGHYADPE